MFLRVFLEKILNPAYLKTTHTAVCSGGKGRNSLLVFRSFKIKIFSLRITDITNIENETENYHSR